MARERNTTVLAQKMSEEFGARVRSMREARGISQERFAEMCSLHRTYYGAVERGGHNVSLVNISKIAVALGVSFEELFRGMRTYDLRSDEARHRFKRSLDKA
jgi:transcriptional regulator with XRE-family HTH domain